MGYRYSQSCPQFIQGGSVTTSPIPAPVLIIFNFLYILSPQKNPVKVLLFVQTTSNNKIP